MTLFVKICGVKEVATAKVCVAAGADAIGLVLASSPRRVDLQKARAIAESVRDQIKVVTVFRRPTPQVIAMAMDVVQPDLVQADHDSLETVPYDKRLPVVREGGSIEPIDRLFLYEGASSGVGQQVDFEIARNLASRTQMILAGGLRPENVASAIDSVRPAGVDVSSGVETSPGVKDHELITEFIKHARSSERTFAT